MFAKGGRGHGYPAAELWTQHVHWEHFKDLMGESAVMVLLAGRTDANRHGLSRILQQLPCQALDLALHRRKGGGGGKLGGRGVGLESVAIPWRKAMGVARVWLGGVVWATLRRGRMWSNRKRRALRGHPPR